MIRDACEKDENIVEFIGNVSNVNIDKVCNQLWFLFPRLEVVQFIDVGSEVSENGPTCLIFSDFFYQKVMRMHIGTLSNVDFILIFYQTTENLEKCCYIEQLSTDIQILIILYGFQVGSLILFNPITVVVIYGGGNSIFNLQEHNLIVIWDLILRDDFHHSILIFCDSLIVKYDNVSQEI